MMIAAGPASALQRRLDRLEGAAFLDAPRTAIRFIVQGPAGLSGIDAVAFLLGQGHRVQETELNIVRLVIGAEQGRPVDLPLADLSQRCSV